MSVRQRLVMGGVASLVVVGGSIGLYATQGPTHSATVIELEDTAEVIYEPDLRAGIDEIRFYEPTTVAVYTHRGTRTDDHALNDATLEYAREARNDWLSPDEQKWADDLFIFAIEPDARLIGTYFGENRSVPEGTQNDIQQSAADDFRRGQWTAGTITGVESAASRMNAPFIRSTGGAVLAVLASLGTLLGFGAYAGVGANRARKSKAARAAGDRAMANVVRDYELTEVHANLIPEGTRYGGAILTRYEEYTNGFRELTEMGNRAKAVPERDYTKPGVLQLLTDYQEKAEKLDELDDIIADTAALLNRDNAWAQAWERQVDPFRDDLTGIESMISSLPETMHGLDEAQQLREFASKTLTDLEQLRAGLESEELSPDDALDWLREGRDGLSGHLDTLAGAVARASSDKMAEQAMMENELRKQRNLRVGRPTILSTADPAWTWFTIGSFRSGYSSGHASVQQSRSSSSSSGGSTSGFSSSSGGSFSGSGSSSRF